MLTELEQRYRNNLLNSVIPFWQQNSLDRQYGGHQNCLTRDGRIWDPRKYTWMQGRAAWMFSKLYNEWEQPRTEWLEAARSILDFLRLHGRDANGLCYFSLTREGVPVYRQRKPYAAFFLAMALIEYSKTGAAGTEDYVAEAREIFWRMREWIADPALLGRPAMPGGPATRQLADLYVVLWLAVELLAVDPTDARYREIIRDSIAQVKQHWLASHRTLLENLPLDPTADHRELPETRLLCPGSAIEVSWIVWHAMEALGDESDTAWLLDVIEGSLALGWDGEHGGLFYFLDAEDLPPPALEASMKLWWPHTEAIYALILAYQKTGEQRWLDWLARVDAYTFQTFADPQYGEWFGYCDRYGRVTHGLKGGPYKGFFHVPRCLLFSLQRLAGKRGDSSLA